MFDYCADKLQRVNTKVVGLWFQSSEFHVRIIATFLKSLMTFLIFFSQLGISAIPQLKCAIPAQCMSMERLTYSIY